MPRFAAPRSLTPSPERNSAPVTRRYTAPVDSDSDSETESSVSASSDEDVTSHTIAAPPIPPKADPEAARLADALASIRLRTRHHDAYEVWATATTKDALTAAKITHAEHARAREAAMARAQRAAKAAETQIQSNAVEAAAALVRSHAAAAVKSLEEFRTHWAAKEKALKSSIDKAIREEEERIAELERKAKEREEKERKEKEEALKKKLEAEKKTREEAERKQREADEKKKQAKEAKRKVEEEKKAEEQREKAKEEQKLKEEEEQKQKEEREKAAIQAIGMSTSQDDWKTARELLVFLKTGPMAAVKGNKALKSQWSTIRRSITPKIGQLTADEGTIDRVTEQICGILQPTPALPLEVYVAGLSALSKAILLQAETEVTAVPKAAIPLAGVTGRLLARLPDFSRIFWARLVQRSGAWCIPCSVPTHEPSGDAMDEKARKKAMGLKDGEAPAEYISRVSGVMRLYFEVMKISTQSPTPLEQEWRLPRAWAWATRLLGRPGMMASTAAPLCVFALLEVLGAHAKDVWGVQWVKLLALFYAASTQGIGAPTNDGKDRPLLGGTTPEGRAARVRVQLEIERSLASS